MSRNPLLPVDTLFLVYHGRHDNIDRGQLPELEKGRFVEYPIEFSSPTEEFPRGKPYVTTRGHALVERVFYPYFFHEEDFKSDAEELLPSLPISIKALREWATRVHPGYGKELNAQIENLESIVGTNEKAKKLLEESA